MSIVVDNEVLSKVVDQFNTIDGLPSPISLKELSKDAPSLLAKQVGGSVLNRTIGGSYDVSMRIELDYRAPSNTEKDVLSAPAILDTLICGALEIFNKKRNLPDLGDKRIAIGYEVNDLCSAVQVTDEGEMIYFVTINFIYHQRSNW